MHGQPAPFETSESRPTYPVRDGGEQPRSFGQALRPTHTMSTSQSSNTSYASTANLVPHLQPKQKSSFFSCCRRRQRVRDSEKSLPTVSGAENSSRKWDLWMGWKILLFGSWLNVLMLLIPAAWILRLAMPESPTLIFGACVLAMIPLVRMHDLSVRELSVRLGGSKTGLLNASMSNIVESVVAVIALRKCELRVVQSSLIGAMLSKLLLILGMCFFAGGMRFTTQGFDSTATQVHSSLLSLSVGAVLLPAAFHFTLSNASGDKTTDIAEQKQDILEMSHGVSIVLIFIYIAYLFFQFWSHSHHFEDVIPPSSKLPNAVSMRSMASKVRPTSPMLRKLASPGATFATVFRSPRAPFAANQAAPPTYVYSQAPLASPPRNGILMNSPAPTAPQMMEAPSEGESPYIAKDGATSTVRLVTEAERAEFAAERFEAGMPHSMARDSMVSDLVSSYYADSETLHERIMVDGNGSGYFTKGIPADSTRSRVQLYEEPRILRRQTLRPSESTDNIDAQAKKPQLSWFLTLSMLVIVTVLVAVNAEWMIDSIDSLSPAISKEWIALILLPTVGSLAECITAINVSVEDQLSLSISVAVGSTIQTALFVIPFMVLLGWVLDKPLALLFDPFESIVLYISVNTMSYVVADGQSNWLEGLILIGLYVVAAVTFWFYPGSNFSSTLAVCST